MSTSYNQFNDAASNLIRLLKTQNEAGVTFAEFEGSEPLEVIISKVLFNAANSTAALGEVLSVNGRTGIVTLTSSDVSLGNVPNVNATNASNISSGTLPAGRLPAHTGDATSSAGSAALTLATVNSTVGTYGDATHVAQVTVDGKGRITEVVEVAISATGTGDVTAASNFGTDNVLIRSNGTGKGVQATGISVDDSDNITGVESLTAGSVSAPEIAISATHATDNTVHGITLSGLQAGASLSQFDPVYLGASSKWLKADANGSGTYPARGLAVAAYSDTDPAVVLTQGTVRHDAWNWTPGGTIYLSTSGGLTQTAPSGSGEIVQQVGFALTADIAYIDVGSAEYSTVE